MSKPTLSLSFALSMAAFAATPQAMANDFPTVDRVLYVQECLRAHPGPNFEMISKCSCAVDRLAEQIKYEDYVTLSTEANASSISGERGSTMRDNEGVQSDAKRFREMQTKAKKSCFFNLDPK